MSLNKNDVDKINELNLDLNSLYKMSFIYHLVFDESKGKWLMNTLTEVHPENYPFHWKQIEVQETHKYLNEKKLNDIAPLLASSLMKGKKEIE